jgi:uncharacterized membrane protein
MFIVGMIIALFLAFLSCMIIFSMPIHCYLGFIAGIMAILLVVVQVCSYNYTENFIGKAHDLYDHEPKKDQEEKLKRKYKRIGGGVPHFGFHLQTSIDSKCQYEAE